MTSCNQWHKVFDVWHCRLSRALHVKLIHLYSILTSDLDINACLTPANHH